MTQSERNEFIHCYSCMQRLEHPGGICPHCGYDNSRPQNGDDLLSEGTVLSGQYLVGRKLGKGGFGVTYLGYDLMLEKVIAIKEYFPMAISSRVMQTRRVTFSAVGDSGSGFTRGLNKFREEALTLAQFESPGIVRVRNFLQENGTAYIIMDFVQGTDLNIEIKKNGRIPWQRVLKLFNPLITELEKLHRHNLIHRDIKPSNIKVVPSDEDNPEHLVLLDFGSARSFVSEEVTGTYTAMVTPGYAPLEQYSRISRQGPYTDVYALCATMYHAITGELPPDVHALVNGDAQLKFFREFGLDVPESVEGAIRHGMTVDTAGRTQSMRELYAELNAGSDLPLMETVAVKNRAEENIRETETVDYEQTYRSALKAMTAGTKDGYEKALGLLREISGYQDTDELAEQCRQRIKELGKKKSGKGPLIAVILLLLLAAVGFLFFRNRQQENQRYPAQTQTAVYGITQTAAMEAVFTEQTAAAEEALIELDPVVESQDENENGTEAENTEMIPDLLSPTPIIPDIPELSNISGTDGSLTVSWEPRPNAVRYEVFWASEKDGPYNLLGTGKVNQLTVETPERGTTLWIRVRACGENECSDYSNAWSYFYPAASDTPTPTPPTATPVPPPSPRHR